MAKGSKRGQLGYGKQRPGPKPEYQNKGLRNLLVSEQTQVYALVGETHKKGVWAGSEQEGTWYCHGMENTGWERLGVPVPQQHRP